MNINIIWYNFDVFYNIKDYKMNICIWVLYLKIILKVKLFLLLMMLLVEMFFGI